MTEIKTMLAPKGSVCRPSYAMKPEYITIHNTANTSKGAGAVSHGSYLQGGGAGKYVSYHYAVDDKQIVRIIPDNEAAWHAGDGAKGTGNRKSIGIEICENPESNLLNATNNTAELVAHLMKDYGIPLGKVVQHNYWTGKNCPNRIRKGQPYDWNTFKAQVQMYYNKLIGTAVTPDAPKLAENEWYTVQLGAFKDKQNAQDYADKLTATGVNAWVTTKEV